MTWHYALNGNQMGPVDQAELDRLFASGTIAVDTLIWKAGMADWKPYAEVNPGTAPASFGLPPALEGSTQVRCSECGRGFAADEVVELGGRRVCAGCKPIVVQKMREGVVGADVENIRNEHIKHEASIKSVGVLYLLGGVLLILGGGGMVLVTLLASSSAAKSGVGIGMGVAFLLWSALQFYTGMGLRRLKRPARVIAGIFSGIGLLGFPVGTLVNGYILYLLFSKKGATVFSDEYQDVIAQTPHIKYRTSIIVWIVLILLIVLIVVGMMGFLLAKK